MNDLVLILAAALIAWAVWHSVRKARRGGGCCGEHEEMPSSVRVADRNRKHYPYTVRLTLGGMTCDACARKVENALNTLPDTWATVSITTKTAEVRLKKEPEESILRDTVSAAGYVVLGYQR